MNQLNENRIRVKLKSTGQMGTIISEEFNPDIYEEVDKYQPAESTIPSIKTPGMLGKVASFLGPEKLGRKIGYGIAGLVPTEAGRKHRETLKKLEEAESKGFLTKGTTKALRTGGVSGREALGSAAVTGLTAALPFAGKAIAPAKAGLKTLMGRSAITGAGFGGASALEQETDIPTGMATGALLGGGIAGTMGLGRYFTSRIPKLLGIVTAEKDEAIKAALRNPYQADIAIKGGDIALRNVVKEGAQKSVQLQQAFNQGYGKAFNKVTEKLGNKTISKQVIRKEFTDLLKKNDVIISKGKLNFVVSDIKTTAGESTRVKDAYNAIQKWDDFSLIGINKLKQRIGKFARFTPEGEHIKVKSNVLRAEYHNLDNIIRKNLPLKEKIQYNRINQNYSDNIEWFDDTVEAFNRGDPFTRIANAIGENKDSLRQILEFYEKKTGKNVLATVGGRIIAAEKSAPFSFLNIRSWMDFFLSPEKQARIVTRTGKFQRFTGKTLEKKLPKELGKVGPEIRKLGRQFVYPGVSGERTWSE